MEQEEKKLPEGLEEAENEEFEKELHRYWLEEKQKGVIVDGSLDDYITVQEVARHFAEWQKAKMMEKSYLATISANNTIPVLPMKDVSDFGLDYGDKVRVIIIKEDK